MNTRIVRRSSKSSDGWNGGDIDTTLALFQTAIVWDGDIPSKTSRDHLVAAGYAGRHDGVQALTGKGKLAALFQWPMPRVWWRRWRRGRLRSRRLSGSIERTPGGGQ